ncbi:hypothetical protein AVEN_198172-1, partial [Araneus ventricosus]
ARKLGNSVWGGGVWLAQVCDFRPLIKQCASEQTLNIPVNDFPKTLDLNSGIQTSSWDTWHESSTPRVQDAGEQPRNAKGGAYLYLIAGYASWRYVQLSEFSETEGWIGGNSSRRLQGVYGPMF